MAREHFRFGLFTEPDEYEETLLRERKAWVEYWRHDGKAEFVRDIIALANTARMIGKPAYLILGVRNTVDGTPDDVCGIGEMLERQIRRGKTKLLARESVRQEMARVIQQYITPNLMPQILFGEIADKPVSYILIPPLTIGPFRVRQEFRSGGRTYLHAGQCWLRFGESKREVSLKELAPEDDRLRYSYAEIPYVLPSAWLRYFEATQNKIERKWQRFPPPPDAAYQEIRDNRGIPLQQIVEEFLQLNNDRLLILQGVAGSGKTLFLQKLVRQLTEEGQEEMQAARRLEQFRPPERYIPIWIPLRDLSRQAKSDAARFEKVLCDLLAPLWHDASKRPNQPQRLLDEPVTRWLILMDGLDEVGAPKHRREFLQVVREFMGAYPRLRVILTTRPVIPIQDIDARISCIAPLSDEQIVNFFLAQRTEENEEEVYTFVEQCRRYPDLWKLMTLPVYLWAVAPVLAIPGTIQDAQHESGEKQALPLQQAIKENSAVLTSSEFPVDGNDSLVLETEHPFLSEATERIKQDDGEDATLVSLHLPRVLDQIYSAFWEREGSRRINEEISELRYRINKLASHQMRKYPDKTERNRAERTLKASGLRWALEMGVLADDEYGHVFFFVPSTQIYSAAKKVEADIESNSWRSIKYYLPRWDHIYRIEVERFYRDMTGQSLQSVLRTVLQTT